MTTHIRCGNEDLFSAADLAKALCRLQELKLPTEKELQITATVKECLKAIELIGAHIPLELIEKEHIRRVLLSHKGNKNQTAKTLEIDRTTLYNKLKKYNLPI